jgi:hypothetical protein
VIRFMPALNVTDEEIHLMADFLGELIQAIPESYSAAPPTRTICVETRCVDDSKI